MLELEIVRIENFQNRNLSELEPVRIGNCPNWNLARIGICAKVKLTKKIWSGANKC